MAHKTMIDGTAYTIKGGRTLVDGTGYAISKGRALVDGTGYDVNFISYDPVFANNDWATIANACHNNKVPDTWVVGDQKAMTINGVDYLFDIIGKNHDDYSDSSGKAPITLQMHDLYPNSSRMHSGVNNSCGWRNSSMRLTHLPEILDLMPEEVKKGIRTVNKTASAGSKSSTIYTSSDKLFLLSQIEVTGSYSFSYSGEGEQYEYYKNGGERQKIYDKGEPYGVWWLRSPSRMTTSTFCTIDSSGSANYHGVSNKLYISFAFCF